MRFKILAWWAAGALLLILIGSALVGGVRLFQSETLPAQETRSRSSDIAGQKSEASFAKPSTPVTRDAISEKPDSAPVSLRPPALPYPVPFISQAPTRDWTRSEFQNGCEEAAALMDSLWREGRTLAPEEAARELVAMARFQERALGQAIDTNAGATAELLLGQYFGITDAALAYDFSLDDLRLALARGVVILPTNGRALGNPNFTRPGPLQHMLVIIGYDAATREFISHDPGTRRGAQYRYPEATLFAAIRDYPTGEHVPITAERRAMIIVPPSAVK